MAARIFLAVAIFGLAYAGFGFLLPTGTRGDPETEANLRRLMGGTPRASAVGPSETLPPPEAEAAEKAKRRASLQRALSGAGSGLRPVEFRGVAGGLAVLLGLVGLAVFRGAVAGVLGVALGLYVPHWWVANRRVKRRADIEKALPDALETMANGLRAGHSFLQALDVAAKQSSGPLAEELARVMTDLRVGRPTEEALEAWAERSASSDVDLLVSGVVIQRQVGGNLASLLDRLQATIRDRQRRRGEIRAMTAQGRMSGWVVGALPAVLLAALSLLDPSMMRPVFATTPGHWILAIAAGLEGTGLLIIRKLLAVEV